jgi:hypothetical protein
VPWETDHFMKNFNKVIDYLSLSYVVGVCSFARYVVQLSTVCSNSTAGDEALQAAVGALFHSESRESQVTDTNSKPKLLWSLCYVQTMTTPRANWVSFPTFLYL